MKQNIVIFFLMVFSSLAQAQELEAALSWKPLHRYGFVVNGLVSDKVVNIGDKVNKGDLLARLDLQPFKFKVKQLNAAVNKFEPLVLDAKLEFDQAEELFERTVLSEVELQKIKGQYESLVAEQDAEKAKLRMAKWELARASLVSKENAYVISSGVYPGMVISDENRSNVYIELASIGQASAIAWLSNAQKLQLKSDSKPEVLIDEQALPASVYSLTMLPNKDNKFQLTLVFKYKEMIEPGKKIKIRF